MIIMNIIVTIIVCIVAINKTTIISIVIITYGGVHLAKLLESKAVALAAACGVYVYMCICVYVYVFIYIYMYVLSTNISTHECMYLFKL